MFRKVSVESFGGSAVGLGAVLIDLLEGGNDGFGEWNGMPYCPLRVVAAWVRLCFVRRGWRNW